MILLPNILFLLNKYRYLTIIRCKAQEGRFMKKVLKENKTRRKWIGGDVSSNPSIPLPSDIVKGAADGKRSANSKRVSVLNKLFMRYITELMATGNNSSQFLGKGIEVNRVMVTPDFKGVNVFWIAKGTKNDDEIESLLLQNAGPLRHELSQLKVMGLVPKIYFLKDKAYAKLIEVDLRLSKADFGEEYVPVEPSYRFISELNLNTTLSQNIKEKIEELPEEIDEEFMEELPIMRTNVLGLNHSIIMNKVEKLMKKSQASHRKNNEIINTLSSSVNEEPVQFDNQKQQKEAFTEFLLKRQILQAKSKKINEKYNPEYEYLRTEKIKYNEGTPFADDLKDELDYIDESEDNKKK